MRTERQKLKAKLDSLTKQIVRERDGWTCQWCGRPVTSKNAHVSHVVPRSRSLRLQFDLMNLKLLCFHCHINVWHKHPLEAAQWFKTRFPDRYKYLTEALQNPGKVTMAELEDMHENLSAIANSPAVE